MTRTHRSSYVHPQSICSILLHLPASSCIFPHLPASSTIHFAGTFPHSPAISRNIIHSLSSSINSPATILTHTASHHCSSRLSHLPASFRNLSHPSRIFPLMSSDFTVFSHLKSSQVKSSQVEAVSHRVRALMWEIRTRGG